MYYDDPSRVLQLPWANEQRDWVALFTRKVRAVLCNLPRGAPREAS